MRTHNIANAEKRCRGRRCSGHSGAGIACTATRAHAPPRPPLGVHCRLVVQALAAAAGVQGSDEELSRNQAVKKALLDDLTATAKAGKLKVWQAAAEWGAGALAAVESEWSGTGDP